MNPYYADDSVQLFLGDCREIVPALDIRPDLVVADPPYNETDLKWDRWPDGWPQTIAGSASSMWCFGSMRMFLDRAAEFDMWKFSQDVVWEKHNGSGFAADRFKRVHEHATHWYRGPWSSKHHQAPRERWHGPDNGRATKRRAKPAHTGDAGESGWRDDGTRILRSVLRVRSMHGSAITETQKPVGIVAPLIDYGCPPAGLVLDPFAGSGTTAVAARLSGRLSVLVEGSEAKCEQIAVRLAQDVLPIGGP